MSLDAILTQLHNAADPNARAVLRFLTFAELESNRVRLGRAITKNNLSLRVIRNAEEKSLTIVKGAFADITITINNEQVQLQDLPPVPPKLQEPKPEPTFDLYSEEQRMRKLLAEEGMTEAQIDEFLATP